MLNVEELKTLLLRQRTTKEAFRWPFSLDKTKWMVLAAYQAEVESRHRQFRLDEGTKQNLRSVAEALAPLNPPEMGGLSVLEKAESNAERKSPHFGGTKGGCKCGLLLCGRCGNGKTTTLYALQNLLNVLADGNRLPGSSATGIVIRDAVELARLATA